MHRWVLIFMALGAGLVFQFRSAGGSEAGEGVLRHCPEGTPPILMAAAEAVARRLDALDRDLAEAAHRLSAVDLDQDAARTVVGQLQLRNADIVIDACTISPRGIMLLVEPSRYRSFEGMDISDQEQVRTLNRTRRPVMSRVFRTVEGMEAVDVEYPVAGPDGKHRGAVSVIFSPWELIGKSLNDLAAGTPVVIRAMQPDGRIIYGADPAHRTFPGLLRMAKRIAAERQGHGACSDFDTGSRRQVRYDVWRVSLTLHGMLWRLASFHPE